MRFVFNPLTGKLDLINDEAPIVSQVFETEVLTIPPSEARASTAKALTAIKYFATCIGPTNACSFEMNVLKVGSGTRDSVSHKLGAMQIQVSSILTMTGEIRIEILNNESNEITVSLNYSTT
jgi:hypothetical protein